jgi:type II secretory pathway pseudopilin PulG
MIHQTSKHLEGISLVEVILTVGLLIMIGIIVIPVSVSYYNKIAFQDNFRRFVADYQKVRANSAQGSQAWAILINSDGKSYSTYANVDTSLIEASGINGDLETTVSLTGSIAFDNSNTQWIYSFDSGGNLRAWDDGGSGSFTENINISSCDLILKSSSRGVEFTIYELSGSIQATDCSGACSGNTSCS